MEQWPAWENYGSKWHQGHLDLDTLGSPYATCPSPPLALYRWCNITTGSRTMESLTISSRFVRCENARVRDDIPKLSGYTR